VVVFVDCFILLGSETPQPADAFRIVVAPLDGVVAYQPRDFQLRFQRRDRREASQQRVIVTGNVPDQREVHEAGDAAVVLGVVAEQRRTWLSITALSDEAGTNRDPPSLMQPAIRQLDATDFVTSLPSHLFPFKLELPTFRQQSLVVLRVSVRHHTAELRVCRSTVIALPEILGDDFPIRANDLDRSPADA